MKGQVSTGTQRLAHLRLGSQQRVNPFRSLPARISLFVFGATLVTSLFVTGISVQVLDTFLRTKIEQRFPEIAADANRTLNAWYDQQFLNLGTLAASDLLGSGSAWTKPGAVAAQLTTALDRFAQFDSLFVLDPGGEISTWVGRDFDLDRETTDALLAAHESPRPRLAVAGDQYVQIISLNLETADAEMPGLLGAVMPLEALSGALRVERLGNTGEIRLQDATGIYVSVAQSGTRSGLFAEPSPELETPGRVVDYTDAAGDRRVGFALLLSQYDLTLAVGERYSEAFSPLLSAFRRVLSLNLAVVLLLSVAAFWAALSIARPIEALSEAARRISRDEQDVQIPHNDARDEVGVLTRTFSEMTARLASKAEALERSQAETEQAVLQMREQNAELQRVNEVLEQLSITDGLTKLHNHRFFQQQLGREIKRATRTGDPLALVLVDIDHFKKWNDRLGHQGGDEVLRRIAQTMNELVRETDILARYGGEEFALILPRTDMDGALQLAEKLRATVAENPFVLDSASYARTLTVSIGVNVYRGDAKALFTGADQALYRAKDGGRDCVMSALQVG